MPKANAIAVSLAVARHDDFITVLEELAHDAIAHVDGLGALPAQLQQRPIRIFRLCATRTTANGNVSADKACTRRAKPPELSQRTR